MTLCPCHFPFFDIPVSGCFSACYQVRKRKMLFPSACFQYVARSESICFCICSGYKVSLQFAPSPWQEGVCLARFTVRCVQGSRHLSPASLSPCVAAPGGLCRRPLLTHKIAYHNIYVNRKIEASCPPTLTGRSIPPPIDRTPGCGKSFLIRIANTYGRREPANVNFTRGDADGIKVLTKREGVHQFEIK